MSLINTKVQPFKANAYKNGQFIEVTDKDLQGKWWFGGWMVLEPGQHRWRRSIMEIDYSHSINSQWLLN